MMKRRMRKTQVRRRCEEGRGVCGLFVLPQRQHTRKVRLAVAVRWSEELCGGHAYITIQNEITYCVKTYANHHGWRHYGPHSYHLTFASCAPLDAIRNLQTSSESVMLLVVMGEVMMQENRSSCLMVTAHEMSVPKSWLRRGCES